MANNDLLIKGMARRCRELLQASLPVDSSLPAPLQSRHLLGMCDRIEEHAEDWPETRLHRWIGFVQCGLMANELLELSEAKTMFDSIKNRFGATLEDQDLADHLDPDSSFHMELGGQG